MKINLTITRKTEGLNIVGKNDEHLSLNFPTGWAQVTFRQYIEYHRCNGDRAKIIALFSGLDENLIRNAEIHNLSVIMACLSFLTKQIEYTLPKKILGYPIADNLDTKSIAQYADLCKISDEFKRVEKDETLPLDSLLYNYSQFPLIVATYAVNPYDFREAEKIAEKFFNAACTEVLAVGNFTLVRLDALSRGIVPTSPPADTLRNRLTLAMKDWRQNLVSTIRYALWKKSLPLSERNYLSGR